MITSWVILASNFLHKTVNHRSWTDINEINSEQSGRIPMATIIIKDLNKSKDMDRQAMRAIAGGSRRSRKSYILGTKSTLFLNALAKMTSRTVS